MEAQIITDIFEKYPLESSLVIGFVLLSGYCCFIMSIYFCCKKIADNDL